MDRVPLAALGLGGAHGTLREHRHRAGLAVHHPLQRPQVVGADQVVPLQELGVEAEVDQVRERPRVTGIREIVEPDHREVVIGVPARVAGRGPVVRDRRPERVAVRLVELVDRSPHPHRDELVARPLHRREHALRHVVEEAHVEDVLEGPHPPRGRGVEGRGVVVGDGHGQGLGRDPALALFLQQLAGAAVDEVLGDVQVVLEDRDAFAVRTLDDERPDAEPGLDPVGDLAPLRVRGGVEPPPRTAAPPYTSSPS